jgi:hypothetical protein
MGSQIGTKLRRQIDRFFGGTRWISGQGGRPVRSGDDLWGFGRGICSAVDRVLVATKGRGILVMDRGGDRRKVLVPWASNADRHFIVRMRGDRKLLYRKRLVATEALARSCSPSYRTVIVRERQGKEEHLDIDFGFRLVRLPECPDRQLWLIVAKGFGRTPMMILTTRRVSRNRNKLWWVIDAYLTRWRIEETIRFIKQSY